MLLEQWQNKFNLVSNNSLPYVWDRHVADSAQLIKYFDSSVNLVYDLGSGAGFPGLVLAILAEEKFPNLQISLIESITKKTVYLNEVKNVLNLKNTNILNARVESLRLPAADMITARAMTSLDNLLAYAVPLSGKDTKMLFPKGRSYQEEVTAAQKNWQFKMQVFQNELSDEGVVLLLNNVRRK